MKKTKNAALIVLYTIILGGIVGAIIWAFLRLMNIGINFVWKFIPGQFNIPFYTIIICVVGSFLIGLYKRKFGDYPEELQVVIGKVKKDGGYPYSNVFSILGAALFPLVLGASVGPEAGLTGVIAGLCTWIGDKLKKYIHTVDELNMIGISATLGTIFKSPMFGFAAPLEDEKKTVIPKTPKVILYLVAAVSSFGAFWALGKLFGSGSGIYSFGFEKINLTDVWYVIPFSLLGIIGGLFYLASHKAAKLIGEKFKKYVLIRCVVGGVILGVMGTLLPLTMFSGEHQMEEIAKRGAEIGVWALVFVAVLKIILTTICIEAGLKGGHFFPIIFSGVCMGYAIGMVTGVDVVFAMALVTTGLVGYTLKKPLAVVLLLMIVFPYQYIPIMIAVALLARIIPAPKCLMDNKND